MRFLCLSGQRYGRLTVTGGHAIMGNKTMWSCTCDCGAEAVVAASKLRSGHTRSCGCLQREKASQVNLRHGMSESTEFGIWMGINKRCTRSTAKSYQNYGGRGIKVCHRWAVSFQNFYDDMGPRPSKNHSLDRINNDGDYEPENCRWATAKQQARNRRGNRMVTIDGVTRCVAEWLELLGLTYGEVKETH